MKKIIYQGAFLTVHRLKGKLEHGIKDLHVTFEFMPKVPFPNELLGKAFPFTFIGYANDGKNEGYSVLIPDELKPYYKNNSIPHMTISIADGAKAVDTGKLNFEKIQKKFQLYLQMGLFVNNGEIIYNEGDL